MRIQDPGYRGLLLATALCALAQPALAAEPARDTPVAAAPGSAPPTPSDSVGRFEADPEAGAAPAAGNSEGTAPVGDTPAETTQPAATEATSTEPADGTQPADGEAAAAAADAPQPP